MSTAGDELERARLYQVEQRRIALARVRMARLLHAPAANLTALQRRWEALSPRPLNLRTLPDDRDPRARLDAVEPLPAPPVEP